jgi:IS605 OrfB family transposase
MSVLLESPIAGMKEHALSLPVFSFLNFVILVEQEGSHSLIVLEELKGVRSVTERVRKCDRWVTVSWAFHQLRQMIEYKAKMNHVAVIAVAPAYTSQTCPKCEHTAKANRKKKLHLFTCQRCGYTSNDDRIGAMNLQQSICLRCQLFLRKSLIGNRVPDCSDRIGMTGVGRVAVNLP